MLDGKGEQLFGAAKSSNTGIQQVILAFRTALLFVRLMLGGRLRAPRPLSEFRKAS